MSSPYDHDIDAALARINANLGSSTSGFETFADEIFAIARRTHTAFKTAALATEELARQGLGRQELLKRLEAALILKRISDI